MAAKSVIGTRMSAAKSITYGAAKIPIDEQIQYVLN
jgi:hypothetical protein